VLLVLLGLAFGLIMEVVIESLLTRLLFVVLAAAVGFWALNNVNADIGPRRPIPEVSSISSTEIKKEQVQLEDVQLSQSGFGAYTLSGNVSNDSNSRLTIIDFQITLKDCRVPEADRLQNANTFKDCGKVLRMTRTGVAWFAVGCQMGAYEHALRYAHERIQFGKPIGGFQLVQDLLVRMLGNVTSCQAMMLRLSQLQDQGLMKDEHASLAKAFTTVKCRETVGYARELLGGNGILLENHVGRYVADAEAIYSYEGTREMNSLIVGKAITGFSAFV